MAATQRGIAGREQFGHAIALMQRYAPLAVNTLAKVITDADAPASAKVAAATTRLRFGREGVELDDLAARVEALEAAICAHDTNTGRVRLVHGRRVLEEVARSCGTRPRTILRVEMDRDTNELEHLAAAIVLVKGECDTLDE